MSSILLTWFNHFCLQCANLFSTGSTSASKTSPFLLWSNKLHPAVRLVNFISAVFSLLISLCFYVQVSQPYKRHGVARKHYNMKIWRWKEEGRSLPARKQILVKQKFRTPNGSIFNGWYTWDAACSNPILCRI